MKFSFSIQSFIPPAQALAGGLLLWLSWPDSPLTGLIFLAWIPLLLTEEKVKSRSVFFALCYLSLFTWNLATTWWIWNASAPGAVSAILANSFIMCLPWLGYRSVRKRLGENAGHLALIAFWMCFEYIHLQDWGLSWPWLTLGNVFATRPEWVQWYEYTGSSGGSLWVLAVNILLYRHLRQNRNRPTRHYRNLAAAALLLALPILASRIIAQRFSPGSTGSGGNVVLVQPNIDPYEKVSNESGSFELQLQKHLQLSSSRVDSNTRLLIWPETALYTYFGLDENRLNETPQLEPLWSFLQKFPQLSLFTGIESIRVFDRPTRFSRPYGDRHVEAYNAAALLDYRGAKSFYHKSMLVPGVETLPWFLRFLGSWFDQFGGTTAGYAKQEERTVMSEKNGFRIAPSICYESIYGEFMSRYVRNGANLIAVITNDGWWKKTPGHRQHLHYARLRAVETRTWLARSANTGISGFIDPYGNLIDPQDYGTQAVIKLNLEPAAPAGTTFFVRQGDLLSRFMIVGSLLLILLTVIRRFSPGFTDKLKS